LNALIIEFNKCSDDTETNSGKITTLITDVTSLKNKITSGYTATQTTGGGSASDAILKRISDLDADYKVLSEHYNGHLTSHPATGSGTGRSGSRTGGGVIGAPTDRYIDIDATTGTGSDTSVNAVPTTGMGLSYSTVATKVITIGTKGEIRGKRLSRQTLNRLRK
jgi:hypothetical protein